MTLPPAGSVKVVEVSTVAPVPPQLQPSSLHFTYFDAIWARFAPIQRLFFYQTSPNDNSNSKEILSQLKESLSLTLRHFYPLAGKLVWPPESDTPSIRYLDGDAVSFTVAESSGEDFHRLTGASCFVPAVNFHPFLPVLRATPEEVPAVAFQVTFFGEEGFSIGYTSHHAAFDGKSTAMFMHSWATICREKGDVETPLKPEHTPYYDRTIISDPTNIRQTFLNMWLKRDGPNNKSLVMMEAAVPADLMRATFLFTRANIEYLKSLVQAKWKEIYGNDFTVRLTTFTVTVAYVWVCLVKSQFTLIEGENSSDKLYLGFAADGRSLVGDPRALNYFGNCVGGSVTFLTLDKMWSENGFAEAAKGIGEAVESLKEGVIPKELKTSEAFGNAMKPGIVSSIAGSPWFKFYDVDFGWGRPKKVEMVSIDHGRAMSLTESRDSKGGIEVGIVLEQPKMEKFASLFASGLEGQ